MPTQFHNPPGGPSQKHGFFAMLRFVIHQIFRKKSAIPQDFVIPKEQVLQEYQKLQHENTMTWLGHAAVLLKLGGKTILVDPYLTDYASPIVGVGPKRYTPPGMSISDLPPIDIVVVTHDHFDHLDLRTLAVLPNKAAIQVVVPLKVGKFFSQLGYTQIQELDWHQLWEWQGISIRALPSYHFSKRNLFTRNTTLWVNYAITWQDKKIYFCGNSAYGSVFLDLGRDYGPFDYAFLSVGAYEPLEIMMTAHVTPELAVRIAEDLRAKTLVPIHWGTVVLSEEPEFEPPERFRRAALQANFPAENIWALKIGETRKI